MINSGFGEQFWNQLANRGHVIDPLTMLSPVLIKNVSENEEEFPPFSFVEIDDSKFTNLLDGPLIGKDVVLDCKKVEEPCSELIATTGAIKIPFEKTGPGYFGSLLAVTYDDEEEEGTQGDIGGMIGPRSNEFPAFDNGPYVVWHKSGDIRLVQKAMIAKFVQFSLTSNESGGTASANVTEVIFGGRYIPPDGATGITVKDSLGCLELVSGMKGYAMWMQPWPISESTPCDAYWAVHSLCCEE